MLLPIIPIYEEKFMSCRNQDLRERIRLLDIDGAYLIQVITTENNTERFLDISEIAFSTLEEANEYLTYDLGIELPGQDLPEKDWIDYEPY